MLGICREPIFLLLLVSVAIYLTLGDVREALILSLSLFVIFGITIFQESENPSGPWMPCVDLSSPRVLVIRDAEEMRIAGREVVRGDTIVVPRGTEFPADAVLISCNELSVDESFA